MYDNHAFARLCGLVTGQEGWSDPAAMPPDVYRAWTKGGTAFEKFVLMGEAGRGGSGVVHAAWHLPLGKKVALKVVSGLDPELRERFIREIRAVGRLSHPGIVPVYDSGESGASLWFAMPLLEGPTLDRVEWRPEESAVAVAAAARAVQAAHDAGVIHRDLKPRNILRDASGVRVMDFGLARVEGESTAITAPGQVLGTPQYMAPEQVTGGEVGRHTDVYGLGATLYRLATGQAPYEAGPLAVVLQRIATEDPRAPRAVQPGVPKDLESIILKAMERDGSRRYGSAALLADDLERFAGGAVVEAASERAKGATRRFLRSRKVRLAAFGVAVAGIAFAIVQAGRLLELARRDEVPPITTEDRTRSLEAQANQLERQGQWAAAAELYTRSLSNEPRNIRLLRVRSHCYEMLGRPQDQEADLSELLEHEPDDITARVGRAWCRMHREDLDGALADADAALALRPGHTEALVLKAEAYLAKGNIAEAIRNDDAAVKSDPKDPVPRASRALAWVRAGRLDSAIEDYDAAIRLGGRQPKWLLARGRAKLMKGDGAGAIADLEAAISAQPALAADCTADLAAAKELVGPNGPR